MGFYRGYYYPPNWDEIRTRVYKLDNYSCVYCGGKNRVLQAHHIKKLSEGGSNNFDNLVTLCLDCHNTYHQNERRYLGLFGSIIVISILLVISTVLLPFLIAVPYFIYREIKDGMIITEYKEKFRIAVYSRK